MTTTLRQETRQSGRSKLALLGAALAASLVMVTPHGAAAAPEPHPFAALSGQWSGGGTIKKLNGSSERIRCRAAYDPAAGNQLQLRLRCASDSYNFDLSANVVYQGGPISGSWSEATRGAGGSIQGSDAGNGRVIQAVARSPAFTASLSLNTRGEKQSIVISSPGSEVTEVAITLDRR